MAIPFELENVVIHSLEICIIFSAPEYCDVRLLPGITDSVISASSEHLIAGFDHGASRARLDTKQEALPGGYVGIGAWVAQYNNGNQFIQVPKSSTPHKYKIVYDTSNLLV